MTYAPRPPAAAAGRSIIKSLADNSAAGSAATRMRRERFAFFMSLLNSIDGHKEILDIGGTQEFWNLMTGGNAGDVRVTLLNIEHQPVASSNFVSAKGDADRCRSSVTSHSMSCSPTPSSSMSAVIATSGEWRMR